MKQPIVFESASWPHKSLYMIRIPPFLKAKFELLKNVARARHVAKEIRYSQCTIDKIVFSRGYSWSLLIQMDAGVGPVLCWSSDGMLLCIPVCISHFSYKACSCLSSNMSCRSTVASHIMVRPLIDFASSEQLHTLHRYVHHLLSYQADQFNFTRALDNKLLRSQCRDCSVEKVSGCCQLKYTVKSALAGNLSCQICVPLLVE